MEFSRPIFRNFFPKKNYDQIFTCLSFKISFKIIIIPKIVCDPELHNLTEVWSQLNEKPAPFSPAL